MHCDERDDHCYSATSENFGTALSKVLCDFQNKNDVYTGYIPGGIDQCNIFFKQIRLLGYPFVIRNSLQKDVSEMPRLFFHFRKEHFNIQVGCAPFCILSHLQMDCISGPSKKSKTRSEDTDVTKTSQTKQRSRKWNKVGCPAKLNIRIIRFFPEYSVKPGDNCHVRRKVMNQLKSAYTNPKMKILYRDRVYLVVSKENIHSHLPSTFKSKPKKKKKEPSNKSFELLERIKNGQSKLRGLTGDITETSHKVWNEQVLNYVNIELEKLLENLKNAATVSELASKPDLLNSHSVVKIEPCADDGADLIQVALNKADLLPEDTEMLNQIDPQISENISPQFEKSYAESTTRQNHRKYGKHKNNFHSPQMPKVLRLNECLSQDQSPLHDVPRLKLPVDKNVNIIQREVHPERINVPVTLKNTAKDILSREIISDNMNVTNIYIDQSVGNFLANSGESQCVTHTGVPVVLKDTSEMYYPQSDITEYSVVIEWPDAIG